MTDQRNYSLIKDLIPGQTGINIIFIILDMGDSHKPFKVADSSGCVNMLVSKKFCAFLQTRDIFKLCNGHTHLWENGVTLCVDEKSVLQKIGESYMDFNDNLNMSKAHPANVSTFTENCTLLDQMAVPSSGTGTQPIGVTRFVNISGSASQVSVVGVSGPGGVTSPSRPNNPEGVLTTSPTFVHSMFVTPSQAAATTPMTSSPSAVLSVAASVSVSSSPPKKKARLSGNASAEAKHTEPADPMTLKRRIIEHKVKRLRAIREKYNDDIAEYFFLQNGGNILDFNTFRKTHTEFVNFMKENQLEADEIEEEVLQTGNPTATVNTSNTTTPVTELVSTATTPTWLAKSTMATAKTNITQSTAVAVSGGTTVAVSMTLPPTVAQLCQQGEYRLPPLQEPNQELLERNARIKRRMAELKIPLPKLQVSIQVELEQEANVMRRIAELKKDGLWSERRLRKAQEPPREKSHWDYLLYHVLNLSIDFAQERKRKIAAAKKCAKMIQKYFQDKVTPIERVKISELIQDSKIEEQDVLNSSDEDFSADIEINNDIPYVRKMIE